MNLLRDPWRSFSRLTWSWSNLLNLAVVILVLSCALESRCDDTVDVLEPLVSARHLSLVPPGEVCDEKTARTIYIELLNKYRTSDLSSVPLNGSVLTDLQRLDKLVCDFKSSTNGIICLNGKCECALPNRMAVPVNRTEITSQGPVISAGGICRLKHGEDCEDSDQCSVDTICSDEDGPERLSRPGEYSWKFKAEDKSKCVRFWCLKEDLRCKFLPQHCGDTSACREDPFATAPFKCILQHHSCISERTAGAQENCQQQCREELNGYLSTNIQRRCHQDCRNKQNAGACFRECFKNLSTRLLPMARLACPTIIPFEECVQCINNILSYQKTGSLFFRFKTQCHQEFCRTDGLQSGNLSCAANCTTMCTRRLGVELELSCLFECVRPGGLPPNPICQIDCFNSRVARFIAQIKDCEDECSAPPISTQCRLCVNHCRQILEFRLQLGVHSYFEMDATPRLPNGRFGLSCNAKCKRFFEFDCIECSEEYDRRIANCSSACQNLAVETLEVCGQKCDAICSSGARESQQAECFGDCFNATQDRLQCQARCPVFQIQHADDPLVFCQRMYCNRTSFQNDVNLCVAGCNTSCSDLLGGPQSPKATYCDPTPINSTGQPAYCKNNNDCDRCKSTELLKCKLKCRDGLAPDARQEQCQSKCLDVCEASFPVFMNQLTTPCEVFCAFTPNTLCSVPCDRYCDQTMEFRCDCLLWSLSAVDPPVPIIIPDFEAVTCTACERRFKSERARICETSICRESLAADPGGAMCMTTCLRQCVETEVFKLQHLCSSISANQTGEQNCVDKFQHPTVLSMCAFVCYELALNEFLGDLQSSVCNKASCAAMCTNKGIDEARRVCVLEPPINLVCRHVPIVPFQTIVPTDPNLDISIQIRLIYLMDCRRRCRLPTRYQESLHNAEFKEVETRNDMCRAACAVNCARHRFSAAVQNCRTSCATTTGDPTPCIVSCMITANQNITSDCAASIDCSSSYDQSDVFVECPNCVDSCSHPDFYKDAVQENQLSPSLCQVCIQSTIIPQCQIICKPSALANTCPDFCADSCLRLKCGEEVRNNYHVKTDKKYILQCVTKKMANEPNEVAECQGICTSSSNCTAMCFQQCQQLHLDVQGICGPECEASAIQVPSPHPSEETDTALILRQNPGVQSTTRRPTQRPTQRPTLRPRPTRPPGTFPVGRFWCCFDNGNGQCNATRPDRMTGDASKIRQSMSRNQQILLTLVTATAANLVFKYFERF